MRAFSFQYGFTLIELVLVLLIVSILAVAGVPKYADAMADARIEAAAERIAADLEHARRQARVQSADQAVVFSPAGPEGGNSYAVPGIKDLDNPSADYIVRLSREPYHVSLVSANFGGTATLTFDRYGVPKNGVGGSVVIEAGDRVKTIRIDPDTGAATAQ